MTLVSGKSVVKSDTRAARLGQLTMEEGERGKPDPVGPVVFDGMLLPPFPPLAQDVQKRINDIKNLGYKKDDVLLAIYPKSGTCIQFRYWV